MNVITHTLTLVETEGGEPLRSPGSFEGSLTLVRDADAVGFCTEVRGPGTAFGVVGFGDVDEEQEWQERALCAQTDPEAFFPEKGGSTREAKRICSGCEVKAECLDYALAHDERFGIWGGLSERERRRLRRLA